MMLTYRKYIPLLMIVIFGFVGMKALFHQGFYTSHDGWHQVARLYHFNEAIRAGQIPPRYSFQLMNGYGYPLFTFSYHIPWILAEPFVLLGISVFDAIKIVFGIGFIVSGIFMYVWQKELWGRLGGLVASLLYMWAPYRFSNIFVRASLGEATSFLFMPLLFYGPYIIHRKYFIKGLVVTGVGLAGVILSHTMLLFILFFPLGLYLLYLLKQSEMKKEFILQTWLSIIIGLMLSAYYLLPATAYTSLTRFNSILESFFQKQFPTFSELLYSPWGYAASYTGVGEMSLQLGIAQWIAVLLSLVLIITFFIFPRKTKSNSPAIVGILLLLVFSFSLISILPISQPLWEMFATRILVDFPWRTLAVLTLISAMLGGFVVRFLPKELNKVVALLLIAVALYANRNHLRVNQYTDIPLSLYVVSEQTSNTYDEYLPKWARIETVSKEGRSPLEIPQTVKVDNLIETVNNISFKYTVSETSKMQIRSLYFPGVNLYVDNRAQEFTYADDGFIHFGLFPGKHEVNLKYEETSLGKIGDGLTIIGIILILIFVLIFPRKKIQKN